MEMKDNSYDSYSPGSSGWTSRRNPEFQEADIWEVFQDAKAPNPGAVISFDLNQSFTSKHLAIPKPNKTSKQYYSNGPKTSQQSSAPVNIPDWSKIHGSSSADSVDLDRVNQRRWETIDDSEEENEKHVNIPPHEWIARKVSRSEIISFSVCEGAGRTLKGRDLSRVRNSVLTKTGFLESN